MYAVEFETQGQGKYIELPFNLPKEKKINVRVILMTEQNIENIIAREKLSLNSLTTFNKGKKIAEFHREDAYFDEF